MHSIRGRRFSLAAAAVSAGAATGVGVFAPMSASAAGNTLTVDNTVSCGTSAGSAVYCTIAAGVKNAAAGDTVVVNPGTYAGGTSVKANGVTVKANGAVTVNGGTHAFTVDGYSGVTISGFTVTNTTGVAFDLGDRSTGATAASHLTTDGLHIVNNTVTGAGGKPAGAGVTGTSVAAGISAFYVTGSVFSGNHLDYNNSYGLLLAAGSNGNQVFGNEASGNFNPTQRAAAGITVLGTDNKVDGNRVHDNQDSGIQLYPGGDHNTVVNNAAWHNGDHGIDNLNTVGGVIVNNTAYGNCTTGINVEGALSSGYTVENNISVDNGVDATCAHGPVGYGVNADGHAGQPGQIRISDGAIGHTVEDHNLVYNSVNSVLEPPTNFQSAGGFDVVAAPGFAGAADFHITSASPAAAAGRADTGAPYVPPADLDGKVRPAGFSLGAFEGNASPQTPKAAATVSLSGYAPSASVTVDASASTLGNLAAGPLTHLVEFGDGATATTSVAQHTYTTAGTFTVKVTVNDGGGHQSSYSQQLAVTAVPPTAAVSLTPSSGFTAPVVVTANAGSSKAFGGLTVADYTFNFGDGSTPITQATPVSPPHTYTTGGTFTVAVTVHDSAGASGTVSKTITVAGTPAPPPGAATGSTPPPATGGTPPAGTVPVYQLGGADRIATGITVSRHRWPVASANSVVLATGANFADALAGVPLAAKTGGPLLLVDGASPTIDGTVMAEIHRVLKPGGTVYVLGGAKAVNAGVEHDLAANGFGSVTRYAGENRYQTSVKIAQLGLGSPAHVIVATGNGFADALAAGPLATGPAADSPGHPAAIILSNDTALDPLAAEYLAGKPGSSITTVGHQAASAVPAAASQLWGGDRYETDAKVAAAFSGTHAGTQVGIASGTGFPDALTGGAYMAGLATPGPIVLVDGTTHAVPAQAVTILSARTGTTEGDIFGGPAVITPAMDTTIANSLHGAMNTNIKLF